MLDMFPETTPSLHDSWLELEINLLLARRLSLWSRQGVAFLLIPYPAPVTKLWPCDYSVELFPKPRISRNQPSLNCFGEIKHIWVTGGRSGHREPDKPNPPPAEAAVHSVCMSTRSAAECTDKHAAKTSAPPCMALALCFVFDLILLILYCYLSKPSLRLCVRGAPP
ncbi:hypothetical protein GGI43DRAFT_64373 [Trichoderma evansii]